MGLFPLPIYAGTTANVLMTILMTYLIRGHSENPLVLPVWAGGVIFANLVPVIALRQDRRTLAGILTLASVCPLFPAWVRLLRRP